MRNRHRDDDFAKVGPKECWHPYGLQALRPEKFIHVANAIIRGDQGILRVDRKGHGIPGRSRPLFEE